MRLDHVNISTTDLEATKDFFVRILGLEVGDRPPFAFPGYWLYGGDRPLVHLVVAGNDLNTETSPIDHFAFRGDDLDALIERLEAEDITHSVSITPVLGTRQVFFRGPEGVKIEVDFPPT